MWWCNEDYIKQGYDSNGDNDDRGDDDEDGDGADDGVYSLVRYRLWLCRTLWFRFQ